MDRCTTFVVAVVAVLFAACGTGDTEPMPTTTTLPALLAETLAALESAEDYAFVVEREGPMLPVDAVPGLSVRRISGVHVPPDRVAADVEGSLGPFGVTIPVVQIADDLWVQLPLAGWDRWTAADLVDVVAVVRPGSVPTYLVEDVEVVTSTDVRIEGRFDTTRLASASGGIVGAGVVDAVIEAVDETLWVVFPDPAEGAVTWRIGLGPVDSGADVAPPG